MRKPVFALLALAVSVPAAAAPAGELRSADGGKRVCRPAAPIIGSHIKRSRACRTAAEWEELDNASRAANITVKPSQPEPWERTRPQ